MRAHGRVGQAQSTQGGAFAQANTKKHRGRRKSWSPISEIEGAGRNSPQTPFHPAPKISFHWRCFQKWFALGSLIATMYNFQFFPPEFGKVFSTTKPLFCRPGGGSWPCTAKHKLCFRFLPFFVPTKFCINF